MSVNRDVLDGLQRAVPAALGDACLALLYLDGGLARPGSEFWLLVRPETSMEEVRRACHPLWARHSNTLMHGPIVARPVDLERYTRLFPNRARYLRDRAELLVGTTQWAEWANPGPRDTLTDLAHLAFETMRCSAILGTTELGMVERVTQLAARQAGIEVGSKSPAIESLAALYAFLEVKQDEYQEYHWQATLPKETPPAYLPGLISLYGWKYDLIVVMPRIDHALLSTIDWVKVRELITNEFTGIMLVTPWQLRLVTRVDMAQDLYLRSFDHVWGCDLLADCQPTRYHLMRTAAALPLRNLIERLPGDYVMTREEELGNLIHDAQNMLLNIQLRSELMARMSGLPSHHPPDPLPGRETPPHQRIAANIGHFRWWAKHLVSAWLLAFSG